MSHDENFKDSTSIIHGVLAVALLAAMPLLPMLTGWFNVI